MSKSDTFIGFTIAGLIVGMVVLTVSFIDLRETRTTLADHRVIDVTPVEVSPAICPPFRVNDRDLVVGLSAILVDKDREGKSTAAELDMIKQQARSIIESMRREIKRLRGELKKLDMKTAGVE